MKYSIKNFRQDFPNDTKLSPIGARMIIRSLLAISFLLNAALIYGLKRVDSEAFIRGSIAESTLAGYCNDLNETMNFEQINECVESLYGSDEEAIVLESAGASTSVGYAEIFKEIVK